MELRGIVRPREIRAPPPARGCRKARTFRLSRVITGWHNEKTAESASVTWDGDKRYTLGDLVGTNEDTGRDYFSSYDGHFFSTSERASEFNGTPDSTRNSSHETHETTQRARSHDGVNASFWTGPLGNGSTGSATDEGTHHQETSDNVSFDDVILVDGPDAMLDVNLPEGGSWTIKGKVTAKGSTDTHTVETGWYRNGEFAENYSLSVNSVRDDSSSTRSTGSANASHRHDSARHLAKQTQNVGQISSAAAASGTTTTNQTFHRWSAGKTVTVNKTVEGATLAYGEGSVSTGYGSASGSESSTGQSFYSDVLVTSPSMDESDTYSNFISRDTPGIILHGQLNQPTLLGNGKGVGCDFW